MFVGGIKMKEVYDALEKLCEEYKILDTKAFKREIEELKIKSGDLMNILAASVPENIPDRAGAITLLLMNEIIHPHFQGFYSHTKLADTYRNIFRHIYKELGGEQEVRFEELR